MQTPPIETINDNGFSRPVILRTAHKDIPFFDERPNFAFPRDADAEHQIWIDMNRRYRELQRKKEGQK